VIVGLFLLGLVVYLLWDKRLTRLQLVAFALLAGGGISNFGDRLFRTQGRVIDFMNMGIGPVRTGVFNVADVAIMVGIAIFAWQMLRERPSE
jgi:signal peptidase II